jgi:hypothetical protein
MKIQEYLTDIRKGFHLRHGFEFGFTESQSEAHFDITTKTAMDYIQGLAMSGKMSEIKEMFASGADAVKNSHYYNDLMQKCTAGYYALDWDQQRKNQLAETALAFAINGLKEKFQAGGYSSDVSGVLKFIGLDGGMMGMLGGMFGKLFK